MSTRIERDSMGEIHGARGPLLGRPDPALPSELRDRGGAPAATLDTGARARQAVCGSGQRRAGRPAGGCFRGDSAGRPGGHGRGSGRALSPLVVWQTGSGTQSNMKRERGDSPTGRRKSWGEPRGSNRRVHPNDHVNRSQSTNDVFPTAIHISGRGPHVRGACCPRLPRLRGVLESKARDFRRHRQDWTHSSAGRDPPSPWGRRSRGSRISFASARTRSEPSCRSSSSFPSEAPRSVRD